MGKILLRRQTILKRKFLTPESVAIKSQGIFENFKAYDFKKTIKKVLVYLPIKNEVDTKLTTEYLKQCDVELFLPSCKNGRWIISKFVNDDGLVGGPYGTRQPALLKGIDVNNLDLAIVPGLAFSKNGFRLGYGKGVYDKLLKNFCGIKVGLAYDFQVVNNFSSSDHDVKMDYVITESEVIKAE